MLFLRSGFRVFFMVAGLVSVFSHIDTNQQYQQYYLACT